MGTKKRIQYRYSSTGQRSLLIDPDGGRFSYTYDSLKRLTQVINPQAQRTTFAYDNAGRRTVKKLANGSRTSFSYDLANRLTAVAQLKSDASVQAKYEYKYDKAGNRLAMAESGVSTARTTWSYDPAYQLTGEHRTGANAYRNTFTYDNRGNRLLKNLDGARTTSSYDDANQLRWTQDGSGRTTYTFDADGNQQVTLTPAGQRTTSVWDYENKLTGVLNPSGTRETMAYDPDGKRVKQQTASDTAKYVWDQQNYLQETDASNVTQATYTNAPRTYGNLISQRKSGATHYYVFDALGSTRLLTDSAEAVAESLLYDAWGNLVGSAPSLAVPFRWVGELGYLFVPSTGDYYVRARVYRPTIGRWISQDPLRFKEGLHLGKYVRNRPTLGHDASGLLSLTPVPQNQHLDGLSCGDQASTEWRIELDATKLDSNGMAPDDLYIVQYVTIECAIDDCGKQQQLHTFYYWESWTVLKGTNQAFIRGVGLQPILDQPHFPTSNNQWGHYVQRGEIRVYRDGSPASAAIQRWNRRPMNLGYCGTRDNGPRISTTGGGLRTTSERTDALFWFRGMDTDPLFDGPAYREFSVYWDCCPQVCPPGYEGYWEIGADANPRDGTFTNSGEFPWL